MIYSLGVDKLPDIRGGRNNNDEETMYPIYRLKRDAEKEKKKTVIDSYGASERFV